MKKKLITIVLVMMILQLTACNNDNTEVDSDERYTETESNVEMSTSTENHSAEQDEENSEVVEQDSKEEESNAVSENEDNKVTENTEVTETTETTESEIANSDVVEDTNSENDSSEKEPTEITSEPTTENVEPETPKYTVTKYDGVKTMYAKSSVNVRNLPNTDGDKVGSLSADEAVEVTGECNETGWYEINYGGTTAYVSDKYLTDKKPVKEETKEENNSDSENSKNEETEKESESGNKFIPTAEPGYGDFSIGKAGVGISEAENTGWHWETGERYYVWIANESEENGGHWEARYEASENNKCTLEELIPYLDKAFDRRSAKPKSPGTYDGEEYRSGLVAEVYLGGGLLDEYK